ncbi:MAG: N-acetylmuramoyl-L-alanine amidase [Chitinophagales bacterium]
MSDNPLRQAREREGALAIVQGDLDNNILYSTKVIEIAPSWISLTMITMLERGELSWDDMTKRIEKSKNIIIGTINPPVADNSNKPLCALVVGHRPNAPGACSAKFNICEFPFNKEIAEQVQAKVKNARVQLVYRDNHPKGYSTLPAKINALSPNFIVSLHCNAASPDAKGTEMLYYHTSTKSHKMAKIMQRKVLDAFNFSNRYTKARSGDDRGVHLLKNTAAPCIITEPFFFSNDTETEIVLNNKSKLVDAYTNGIDEIASTMF